MSPHPQKIPHAQKKLADIRAGRTSQANLIQNVERVITVDFIAFILRDARNELSLTVIAWNLSTGL